MPGPAVNVKPVRFIYASFNNRPGLTDVKGQIFVNGIPKAVGAEALPFAEISSANARGEYTLVISGAQLATWGVVAGGENTVHAEVNSATWPGPTPIKVTAQVATADDILAYIGSPAGASVSADIKSVSDKIGSPVGASVSADVASLSTQGAQILTQLQALANATTISGGAAFILPAHISSPTNPMTIVIPIPVLDNDGDLVDPTGGITIGVKNQAGVDRGNYLQGSSGSPATVQATKNSVGQYQATVILPANAPLEELLYTFSYQILGKPQIRYGVAQVTSDNSTQAQQATLTAVQATVNAINTAVQSSSFGLAALLARLTDPTSGLAAIQGILVDTGSGFPYIKSILSNTTYGLAKLAENIAGLKTELDQVLANQAAVMGAGFDTTKHSLSALAAAIALIPISGGRGV